MNNGHYNLREFGKFQLDPVERVLLCGSEPVDLPLKEIDLLCVLTERCGQIVTKDELLDAAWHDSFVEEGNLARRIYLIRKTFKELGEREDLIQTVPRRGYRFTGSVREVSHERAVVVAHNFYEKTTLEVGFEPADVEPHSHQRSRFARPMLAVLSFAAVLTIVGVGIWYFGGTNSRTVEEGPKSIAVMPFSNLLDTKEDELLAEGVTDAVTARLGTIPDLVVRPGASTRAISEQFETVQAIGSRLSVDAVLQGSILRDPIENVLTLQLQLFRVSDGKRLWEEKIEQQDGNFLALQSRVAASVAEKLSANLSPERRSLLAKQPTRDIEAYWAYLRGNARLAMRSPAKSQEAIDLYRLAIARDPSFALAYVGLADAYAMAKTPAPEAEAYLQKALELDNELAEAHASLGFIQMFQKWDWANAERSLRRAIELDPNSAKSHQWLATHLALQRRFDEAELEIRRALEIDPTSVPINSDLCEMLFYKKDLDAAEAKCESVFRENPDYSFPREMAGSYASRDVMDEFRKNGFRAAVLRMIEAQKPGSDNQIYAWALRSAEANMRDEALMWLRRGVDKHIFLIVFANADPVFDRVRDDERFQAEIRRMGL